MDERLGAEARLARELGVSVRELYGWTPRTFTRYSYDEGGRLAESVSWTETRWLTSDRALLLASRRENIGPHGVPMDEAMNPDNAGRFVVKASRDYAQQAVTAMRKDYEKKYPHEDLSAFMFRAELPPEAAEDHSHDSAGDAREE